MDGGFVPTPANTDAGDLRRFCDIVSRCAGRRLDPAAGSISVSAPAGWQARNADGFLVLCRTDSGRCAIIKRCLDDPEYMRRELLIASAKEALGWEPRYSVERVGGVRLRGAESGANPPVLAGWEGRPALVIDIGDPDAARDMNALRVSDIADMEAFCRACGGWGAFNYLLGVYDRNPSNLVFLTDAQELHSIDNEEGPFNTSGVNLYEDDVVLLMRITVSRFIGTGPRGARAEAFRAGFMDGWRRIKSGMPSLSMLGECDMDYLKYKLSSDPNRVVREFLRRI